MTAMGPLSLNMFVPALPSMAADLATDYATISWAFSGYLGIMTLLLLVFGPLSDRFGRRPVALSGLAIFGVASIGCAFAQSVEVLLIFRVLQSGVAAAAGLAAAIVKDTRSAREAASLLGYIAMAMALAPMLGPVLGGFLEVSFGWRAIFLTYALISFAVLAGAWVDLRETNLKPSPTMSKQFATYPKLLREPAFWGYALTASFATTGFYVFLAGAPLVSATVFQMEPSELGLYIGSITLGYMGGSFAAGRLGKHLRLSSTMLIGRAVALAGLTLGLALIAFGVLTPLVFFGATLSTGIGNGLSVPAGSAGAMSVRPDLVGSASGLVGALTVGTGALLAGITAAALTPQNAAVIVLAMMLLTNALSCAATFLARHCEDAS